MPGSLSQLASLALAALVFLAVAAAPPRARAQEFGFGIDPEFDPRPVAPVVIHPVVYKLEFRQSEDSLNFDFFDGGFFIGPAKGSAAAGLGTFVFTSQSAEAKTYVVVPLSGHLFFAKRGATRRMIIGGGNVEEAGFSGYLAIGAINTRIRLPGTRVALAATLTGHVLAAADESGLEGTEFASPDGTQGVGAKLTMTASLQRGFTLSANPDEFGGSIPDATDLIVATLESFGYIEAE